MCDGLSKNYNDDSHAVFMDHFISNYFCICILFYYIFLFLFLFLLILHFLDKSEDVLEQIKKSKKVDWGFSYIKKPFSIK